MSEDDGINKLAVVVAVVTITLTIIIIIVTIYFNSGMHVKNACVFVIGSSRNVTDGGRVGG